jgi:hypothetical protein
MRRSESQVRERKRSALDWAARIVEENGRELAESFLSAARNGDWRAAEALMNRIYGKPEQPLAVTRPVPSALEAFARSLSLDEKLELLATAAGGRVRRDGTRASDRRGCAAVRLAPPGASRRPES